jgi:hypothetical protein
MGLAKEHKLQQEIDRENRDSAINRAMAEVAGWTQMGSISKWKSSDGRVHENWGGKMSCPNFLIDLNAVATVVGKLLFSQRRAYRNELKSIMLPGHTVATEECIDATARQRCEAILKTLNRWNPEWDR